MCLIFSQIITPRLQYIADFISKENFDESLKITSDAEVFNQFAGPKINYSNQQISENEFWIKPHTLLFEKIILPQNIQCFEVNEHKAFFKTEGDCPFDIFAAAFFLLSRYEEYLPHEKDMYGRYAHQNSLAYKENFLHLPLINQWLEDFKKSLKRKLPNLKLQTSNFKLLPTYDIDEAWSYKHKGWWRSTGAAAKKFLKGEWTITAERRKVLAGKISDPFDAYEWMDQLHQQYNLHPVYFFLVPDTTGKYDRNILPKEPALQKLIKQHAGEYKTGIHPSWQSGDDPSLIKKEIRTIESITGKKITVSRQHFIRFRLPQTFRYLIEAGIKEDFSMGYGSINGFRASVASPFYWYDLGKEKITNLLLYPFCFMEANSFFEQKFSPQQALEEMRHYYHSIKAVNGIFISIWHNSFLGTGKMYAGWREIYEQFIKKVS